MYKYKQRTKLTREPTFLSQFKEHLTDADGLASESSEIAGSQSQPLHFRQVPTKIMCDLPVNFPQVATGNATSRMIDISAVKTVNHDSRCDDQS